MRKYKIGFDIGGVITTHTNFTRDLISILKESQAVEVFIVSDMSRNKAKVILSKNNFEFDFDHILYADWSKYESRCKEEVCRQHKIDVLIDDHKGISEIRP